MSPTAGAVLGKLYLVGTPIGNLGDITLRALETLKQTRHIAAEDTRRTRQLLTHFSIVERALHALDANASPRKIEELLQLLEGGEDIALVTDAGMPSVSDPGTALVRGAHARGIVVVPIPGASAVTAAVGVSGLVDASFVFLGFLPRHGRKRKEALGRIEKSSDPVLIFESPQRMAATLRELSERIPARACTLCREITKLHEEIAPSTVAELAAREGEWRGEITLVIAAAGEESAEESVDLELLEQRARARLAEGATVKTVVAELGEAETGLARREIYALVQRVREEVDLVNDRP
ncbi:MAG TPA: 16S rRNA (cytidine(1402)-2'-O)-methyltransferase [Polyangiaceae bacterium]|nr:16S rRNA (cytidine(1402)-2'-O)-methyltransferase [Polyangiaceae bacterium]